VGIEERGRILRVAQNDKDKLYLSFVILSNAKNPSQASPRVVIVALPSGGPVF